MDTFLGPVYLATGFDEHGNQAFYLFLGGPSSRAGPVAPRSERTSMPSGAHPSPVE